MRNLAVKFALIFAILSFFGCGGNEEKETRALPDEFKGQYVKESDFIIPKSYVREKQTNTPPPFIAILGVFEDFEKGIRSTKDFIMRYEQSNASDILEVKANKGNCQTKLYINGSADIDCGEAVKQIELTTKSNGKVTYKF